MRGPLVRADLDELDGWRSDPSSGGAGADYKEWMHFCIEVPGSGLLLVNFNVCHERSATGTVPRWRLFLLGYDGSWTGRVEGFDASDVRGRSGRVGLRAGAHTLEVKRGEFHLTLRSPEIDADLVLAPELAPTTPTCVRLGPAASMHWLLVGRLAATGVVRLAGKRIELDGALAYHDHNWGRFAWGADISWEWGYAHVADDGEPITTVWARVSDGRRLRTLSQTLLCWRGSRLERVFQGRELEFEQTGTSATPPGLTLPRIANLVIPGPALGVPDTLRVRGRGAGDELELTFRPRAVARIGVPADSDPFRLLLLNEVGGEASLKGTLRNATINATGGGVGEFMRG